MPRRRPGQLLPLEEQIIEVGLRLERKGVADFYGFALAEALTTADGAQRLLGHGTLYKALSRLEDAGLLESRWEDVDCAAVGRPRRRLYRLTGLATTALAQSRADRPTTVAARRRWAVT